MRLYFATGLCLLPRFLPRHYTASGSDGARKFALGAGAASMAGAAPIGASGIPADVASDDAE